MRQGNHADAEKLLSAALRLRGDKHDVYRALGRLYVEMGRTEWAIASFEKALALMDESFIGRVSIDARRQLQSELDRVRRSSGK